jgi:hypothetical protein
MMNWFYNWLDPKILTLEKWVNRKVVNETLIDVDLDKLKPGEVRVNNMFRQPPKNGDHGPFLAYLQGGSIDECMVGVNEFEAFSKITYNGEVWWRHRDGGTTEDFKSPAFKTMKEFFEYCHGDTDKYWDCQLRTKALKNDEQPRET